MDLNGALPFNTILALEAEGPAVKGVLGQTKVVWATFTYGIARGATFVAGGFTSWRQLPWDRDGGLVQADADPEVRFGWQSAPADVNRRREPDLRRGLPRSQPVADQDRIGVEPGAFVRFELSAPLTDGRPLPKVPRTAHPRPVRPLKPRAPRTSPARRHPGGGRRGWPPAMFSTCACEEAALPVRRCSNLPTDAWIPSYGAVCSWPVQAFACRGSARHVAVNGAAICI
jgi:hypothetical protein